MDLVAWYDLLKWCNARSEKEGRVPAYYTTPEHTNVFRTGNFGGFLGLSSDLVNWTGATWYRALRGGNWEYTADCCRVADREDWYPDAIDTEVGFRCVLRAGHP